MRYLWLLVILSGCVTQEQRAADVLAAYGPYCEKLGYTRDTDAWRQCVQAEDAASEMRAYLMMRRRY